MNRNFSREAFKDFLGDLPLLPEMYWSFRQPGRPVTAKFDLKKLQNTLPNWIKQMQVSSKPAQAPKKVLVFATLRYWVEYASALALALAGQGHQVTFAFLPFSVWHKSMNRFDLRRQNAYTLNVFTPLKPVVNVVSFLNTRGESLSLPDRLDGIIRDVALKDTQYTLQMEIVDLESELHQLRLERNRQAAWMAYKYMQENPPDIIVIPNGTILEFGAVYQVSRYLGIPVVTFEFGEQRERIWLAQDGEVMRQDTTLLWEARRGHTMSEDQKSQIRELFAARQRASLWENFARRWQGVPSAGGELVRSSLKLDSRPIVLLATNVIGDSLTLGRQVFSDSMTEWLRRTVEFFAHRPEVQFVIRIHPGELITKGPSVADVVQQTLASENMSPLTVDHIHLIPADAKVNTYDLVEIANFGLVYTTTVGLEMAMSGISVIVVGNTHYRKRGFTLDPDTWEEYFEILSQVHERPAHFRLSKDQVDLAWNYAYRFFFEYPHPFPWHLVHFWEDMAEWPVERVLSDEGQAKFGQTFRYLVGEPVIWQ
jgi:hypothetical protein